MLKKRLIFTLLYDSGSFMLSRNFRLQKVGNIEWLKNNYNFSHISFYIDELIVLDVSRKNRNLDEFCEALKILAHGCFVPIAAGGGVRTLDQARKLLRSGADKVVINTPLYENPSLVSSLASEFGQQCIVGSVDILQCNERSCEILLESGSRTRDLAKVVCWEWVEQNSVGELYLTSVNRDGTGNGLDFSMIDYLPPNLPIPVILAGGVGSAAHILEGLLDPRINAVATANLFNFVGDGLKRAREFCLSNGGCLANWPPINDLDDLIHKTRLICGD